MSGPDLGALSGLLSGAALRAARLAEGKEADGRPSPGTIRFTSGNPDAGSLPVTPLQAALDRVLRRSPRAALWYAPLAGPAPLREAVAGLIARDTRMDVPPGAVAITAGAAPALELLCSAFLDPGDVAVTQEPTWKAFTRSAADRGARVASCLVEGPESSLDELEQAQRRAAAEGRRVKLLYVVPDHGNPTGCSMSEAQRRAVIEWASRHSVLVVEFSKTLATGLRIGWLCGDPLLLASLEPLRFDNGVNPLVSLAIVDLIESGHFDRHVRTVREVYRRKAAAVAAGLAREAPSAPSPPAPRGGMFVWLPLPAGVQAATVVRVAEEAERVATAPGTSFYPVSRGGVGHLRLCYASVPEADVLEGASRLGRVLRSMMAGAGQGRP